jgi:hypothetical protein
MACENVHISLKRQSGYHVTIQVKRRWTSDKTSNFEGVDISYLDESYRGRSVTVVKFHWVELSQ